MQSSSLRSQPQSSSQIQSQTRALSSIGNPDFDDMEISGACDFSDVGFSAFNLSNLDPYDSDHRHFTNPDQGTGVQETVREPPLEVSSPTNFPLLRLPLELRLLIYEPLIAAGDLNITRTNKLVHKEAENVLKKNAVLRMNFGYANRTSSASLPLTGNLNLTGALKIHAIPTIQHVELHFNLAAVQGYLRYFDVYTNLIKSFGGRVVARQTCTIYIDIEVYDSIPDEGTFAREAAWQAITDLTGFKTLVVKIRRQRDYRFEEQCLRRLGHLLPQTGDSYPHKWLLDDYQTLCEILKITLGPAIQDKSLKGHHLKFHPSDFKPEENGPTDSAIRERY